MNVLTEQARLQAAADKHRADARRPLSLEELALDVDDAEPTDIELVDVIAETFDLTHEQAAARLAHLDIEALRKLLP